MSRNHLPSDRLLLIALVLSGTAALSFELLWTRLLSLILGAEVLGILGVLAGFFGGMVLGAHWMSRRAAFSQNPLRTFFILEGIIALFGLISPWLLFTLNDLIPVWLGPVTGDNSSFGALLIIVVIAGLLLLPATFCMGANFAYLVEARRRIFAKQHKTRNIGRIYAANTAGALAGTLVSIYLILPAFGFRYSALIFAAISLASIAAAFYWRKGLGSTASSLSTIKAKTWHVPAKPEEKKWMTLLFFTGLLAIGFEIAIIHLLKQVLENTIYTFGNILSVYLLGTALGAWLFQSILDRIPGPERSAPALLFAILVWLVLDLLFGTNLHAILDSLSPEGKALTGHLLAEWLTAALFFFIPSLLMGGLFTLMFGQIRPPLVGKAYALNTLGATLAPFLFGLGTITWLGSYGTFLIMGVSYALLLFIFNWLLSWKSRLFLAGFAILIITLFIPRESFDLVTLETGWERLERKEGLMGTVVVSELPGQTGPLGMPLRMLHVNNRFRMGGGAGFLEKRMGHLPLLLSGSAEHVLFLGIGTGTTLGAATEYNVDKITGVEIQPEVADMLNWFKDYNGDILNHEKASVHTADARRFVLSSRENFDLIVADLYHPARDGAGLLYTREHFAHLREKLNPGGSVMQWIPLYQFDTDDLKQVLRTFQSVFPETHLFLGGYNPDTPVLGVWGVTANFRFDPDRIKQNILSNRNIQVIFENVEDVISSYVCGPNDLKTFTGNGRFNTDDHPRLLFEAPESAYVPQLELAKANLQAIHALRKNFPSKLMAGSKSDAIGYARSHWDAAGHFIEYYINLMHDRDNQAMKSLFSAYRAQPDFSPARGKILEYLQTRVLRYEQVESLLTDREKKRLGK